jgi:UDP-glucose:(heptosyl)LPS alpha-1,3-glucosyltransferase
MAERAHRIAVVIPKYGLVGGAEGFAAEITERLALDPRFEFHVFANRWAAGSDRVRFHRVPIVSFPKFLTTPSFAYFADRLIRKTGVEIIHTHERIFRADLATLHGVPHRFWVREVRRKHLSLYDRATVRTEERLLSDPACRVLMPVSHLAREILLAEYPLDPQRIRVVHPGVDAKRFDGLDRQSCRAALAGRYGIAPGEKIVLFVSMNFEVKGLDALIGGLALLAGRPSAPPFRLVVAGKGNTRKYGSMAASLGIAERVIFTGVVPCAKLPSLYAAADLYAMLSRFDTFGMVVLEAMAASLPVLVSDRVGARDLVRDGVDGFVIPLDAGPEEIAGRLALLFAGDARERMGRDARETALANGWDAAAARIAAIYGELLSQGGAR